MLALYCIKNYKYININQKLKIMKQSILAPAKKLWNKAAFLIALLLFSVYSFAQDKKVDININTEPKSDSNFFMQPWVWIAGGAVFILLLVALLRNNNSSKA